MSIDITDKNSFTDKNVENHSLNLSSERSVSPFSEKDFVHLAPGSHAQELEQDSLTEVQHSKNKILPTNYYEVGRTVSFLLVAACLSRRDYDYLTISLTV